MEKLKYDDIKELFDKKVFENSKIELLTNLQKYPNRFIGLFRPTKPSTKIIQNMTQSHEIRFGDAFELFIRRCFETYGYTSLTRNYTLEDNSRVNFDQLFKKDNKTIFIEQKLRDDHDSTKKRGQMDNFKKKLNYLAENNFSNISSYIYFIDSSLVKNKKYYLEEIKKLSNPNVNIELCYGNELFEKEKMNHVWENEIICFLKKWNNELPEMPQINFDINSKETFEEIKDLKITMFNKIFKNEEIVTNIFPIIFPTKETLNLLLEYFKEKSESKISKRTSYSKLCESLTKVLQKY